MNSNNKAIKSGVWYLFSDFLLRAIGLVTTPFFTRLLTKSDFGAYSNYHSWQLIINIFITMNISATLISAKYDYKKEFDQYILSICAVIAFNSMVFFILVNILSDKFETWFNIKIGFLRLMSIYIFFSAVLGLYIVRERYYYKYKTSVFFSLSNVCASTILSLLFVVTWENRLEGRIVGMSIPTIVLGTLILVYFIKKGRTPRFYHIKYAIPICLPYIPHSLSLVLLSSMDKIQITALCGSNDNALYSAAYTCGSAITLFVSSMNHAFVPWLADHLESKNYKSINDVSRYYIGYFLFGAIGVMLMMPEILFIIGGRAYEGARFVMAPVALGIIFQFLYTMLVNIEQFEKNTKPMAMATMIAAFVNYITNTIFIKRYGYMAAAYTTAGSYFLLLILHMIIVYRMGMRDIYSYRFFMIAVTISTTATVFIEFLFHNNMSRYTVLAIYIAFAIIVLYKSRNKILIWVKRR